MSARPFILFPLVTIVALATAIPSRAQRGQSLSAPARVMLSIAGEVWDDATQQRMENVRVDLKTASGEVVNTVFTGSNGEFEFMDLGNGQYFIEVALKDYEHYRQAVIVQDSPTRGVSVFLRRSVSVENSASVAPSVSAHQLAAPTKAREAFDKGETLLYVKSNYQGAIEQFDRAIKSYPDYYEAYAEKGVALTASGKNADGEAAFRTSIDLSKRHYPQAMFLLAGFFNDSDHYSDAEPLAREGLALDGTSWRGHLELARALVGLKQPDEAEKNASVALGMKPDQPAIYLVLANIHIQQQNAPALLQDLEGYLKVAPNGPAAEQARKTRDELQASLLKTEPAPPPPSSLQQ